MIVVTKANVSKSKDQILCCAHQHILRQGADYFAIEIG
jgi:hypothetical protein